MKILLQVIAFTATLAITMVLQTAMSVRALAQAPYRPLPKPYIMNMHAPQQADAYCYAVQRSTVPPYAVPAYAAPQYSMAVQPLIQPTIGHAPSSNDPRLTLSSCVSGGAGPIDIEMCKGKWGSSTEATLFNYFTFGGSTNSQGQRQYYGCMGPSGSVGVGVVGSGSTQLCLNQHGNTNISSSLGVGLGAGYPEVVQGSVTTKVSYQTPVNPGTVSRNLTTGPPPWLLGR